MGNDSTARWVAKAPYDSFAHADPCSDRVTGQEIRRVQPSAASTLQFAHGERSLTAGYDQSAAVRSNDGARSAEPAWRRLRRPDLDRFPVQQSECAGDRIERPHLAIDRERRCLPIDERVLAGDLARVARAVIQLRKSIDVSFALKP